MARFTGYAVHNTGTPNVVAYVQNGQFLIFYERKAAEKKAKELNDALLRVAPGAKSLYVVEEVSGTTVSRAGPDPKPQPGLEVGPDPIP